jgi:hypothetical protein
MDHSQTVGSDVIIDAVVTNTPTFIFTPSFASSSPAGSIVFNNVKVTSITNGLVHGLSIVGLAGGD